ncbi:MAG: hypothetical protein HY302_12940 [Opitutae bacterium]|nr:hypothetical protein [Opitutae bacterium]
METRIALFQKKEIRKTLHQNEWWFVIVDVVAALTDSANATGYFKDMRRRDPALTDALKGGGQIAPPCDRDSRRSVWTRARGLVFNFLQAHDTDFLHGVVGPEGDEPVVGQQHFVAPAGSVLLLEITAPGGLRLDAFQLGAEAALRPFGQSGQRKHGLLVPD